MKEENYKIEPLRLLGNRKDKAIVFVYGLQYVCNGCICFRQIHISGTNKNEAFNNVKDYVRETIIPYLIKYYNASDFILDPRILEVYWDNVTRFHCEWDL